MKIGKSYICPAEHPPHSWLVARPRGTGAGRPRGSVHKGPESDPGTNRHLSSGHWVVLGTLLGQSLVRIDFECHFVEVPHHGVAGDAGVQARGKSDQGRG